MKLPEDATNDLFADEVHQIRRERGDLEAARFFLGNVLRMTGWLDNNRFYALAVDLADGLDAAQGDETIRRKLREYAATAERTQNFLSDGMDPPG